MFSLSRALCGLVSLQPPSRRMPDIFRGRVPGPSLVTILLELQITYLTYISSLWLEWVSVASSSFICGRIPNIYKGWISGLSPVFLLSLSDHLLELWVCEWVPELSHDLRQLPHRQVTVVSVVKHPVWFVCVCVSLSRDHRYICYIGGSDVCFLYVCVLCMCVCDCVSNCVIF